MGVTARETLRLVRLLLLGALILLGSSATYASQDGAVANGTDWGKVIVTIQASRVQYSFYQPWYDTVRRTEKNGVLVEGRQILTTADWLQNSTLVRVQRNGRGRWWNARLLWVDYHTNLAVVVWA